MVTITITQILSSAFNGKINYYYAIDGDTEIRNFSKMGYFTIDFEYWGQISDKIKNTDDIAVDAEVVRTAFKHTYDDFKIIIDGKDVTPAKKNYNEKIREELEDGHYTLDELFEMLEEEDNLIKKSTGFIKLTAKYKRMIINNLIFKKFEDMEADYKQLI